ncbi:hypothetical protein B0O99DRAFT_41559 [Bisporella sp. PMI_857]|nr:hypothetical protein B0O99DRAFT_41559 [Bisporella sp. PMI_857]
MSVSGLRKYIRLTTMPQEYHMGLGEDAVFLAGATGVVVATDQIAKGLESEDHTVSHLSKAAIGAAVAIGAYEHLRREQEGEKRRDHHHHHHHHGSSHIIDSSHPHHEHHLVKEIIGAYRLGKELTGDKRHHFSPLVEQAVGAVGLLQDVNEKRTHTDLKALQDK